MYYVSGARISSWTGLVCYNKTECKRSVDEELRAFSEGMIIVLTE
jgi:hypothetical protein